MADLIDRQAAIYAAREELESGTYFDIPSKIEALPAVQPDHNANVSKKVSISCSQENDLISRQAALKELAVYIHLIDKTMGKGTLADDDCMEAAKSVLGEDELPAVQPERKHGKWESFDFPWFRCSECGAVRENVTFMENFCPNCGAKMRGMKDG